MKSSSFVSDCNTYPVGSECNKITLNLLKRSVVPKYCSVTHSELTRIYNGTYMKLLLLLLTIVQGCLKKPFLKA